MSSEDDSAAKSATLMRQHVMFFSEADVDGSLDLTFDEVHPPLSKSRVPSRAIFSHAASAMEPSAR